MPLAFRIGIAGFALLGGGLICQSIGCASHRNEPAASPTLPTVPAIHPATASADNSMTGIGKQGTAAQPKFVSPIDFWDFASVIGDPPPNDSAEHREEIGLLLALQASRTPEQVRQCQAEDEITVFAFSDVFGSWFDEGSLPLTARLMRDVLSDTRLSTNAAKQTWKRDRPPTADPRIKPCVEFDPSSSYPSGNAARGIVFATLLARAFPDKSDALLTRAKSIGDNRILAGMHWPSDVYAGQLLGIAIVRRLEANGAFLADLGQGRGRTAICGPNCVRNLQIVA